MPFPELTVIGIDPGVTTGWAKLVVPRKSIYGDQPSEIIKIEWGHLTGPEDEQVDALLKLASTSQGMSWKVGPALVCEAFELLAKTKDEDLLSPVRIAAKVEYGVHLGKAQDAKFMRQHRTMAKTSATDDRLKAWGLWVPNIEGGDHARDAMRHAITALRRAKAKVKVRDAMWAYWH